MRAAALALAACVALAAGTARGAPQGSPWGSAYFPDVLLTTQEGKTVRFYGDLVKDKFVVINFIFTRCKAACPLETANLARVQKLLAPRVGRDIFMYSITLDPEHDTPAALKAYAEAFHAGPGWLFLTGKREDIQLVRRKLGDRSGVQNHAVGLSLGNDPAGQWTTLSAVDNAGFIAVSIDEWMRAGGTPHAPVKSYAEAPRPSYEPGEALFRSRCMACHTIGGGASVGPDLQGITDRRQRDWLARWLASPEKLLAEKDPLAMQLAERHRQVTMPSFNLGDRDAADLISYMEAQSKAAAAAGGRQATAVHAP